MQKPYSKFSWNDFINRILQARYSRKSFLRLIALLVSVVLLSSRSSRRMLAESGKELKPRIKRKVKTKYDIIAVQGEEPSKITRKAVDELGGMKQFVKKGDIVVVKPNIAWDRTPEQAGNTNPV